MFNLRYNMMYEKIKKGGQGYILGTIFKCEKSLRVPLTLLAFLICQDINIGFWNHSNLFFTKGLFEIILIFGKKQLWVQRWRRAHDTQNNEVQNSILKPTGLVRSKVTSIFSHYAMCKIQDFCENTTHFFEPALVRWIWSQGDSTHWTTNYPINGWF